MKKTLSANPRKGALTAKMLANGSASLLGIAASVWALYSAAPDWLQLSAGLLCGVFLTSLYTAIRSGSLSGTAETLGITGISNRRFDSSLLGEKILMAGQVRVIVNYGDMLLVSQEEKMAEAIRKGCNVQVMLAPLGSRLIEEAWELEGARRPANHKAAFGVLDRIAAAAQRGKGNLEVKLYNTQIRSGIIIVDDAWVWWTPYLPGVEPPGLISFELAGGKEKPAVKNCVTYFDKLWKNLKPAVFPLEENRNAEAIQ